MDAVERPVQRHGSSIPGQPVVFCMEQETVQHVLSESPREEAKNQQADVEPQWVAVLESQVRDVSSLRPPCERNGLPRRVRESFEEPLVKDLAHAYRVDQVLGFVNELDVVFKGVVSPLPELVEDASVVVDN